MLKAMCKPCSMGEVAAGMKVKQVSGKFEKITCDVCKRRRFGATFDVTKKEEHGK